MKIFLTAGDTWPTTGTITDNYLALDITGYTIEMEIAYTTPLVKTAVITDASNGLFEIQWTDTDLVEGTWDAALTITNASSQTQTTENITLSIKADLTPVVVP